MRKLMVGVFDMDRHGDPLRRRHMTAKEARELGVSDSRIVVVAGGIRDRDLHKRVKAREECQRDS